MSQYICKKCIINFFRIKVFIMKFPITEMETIIGTKKVTKL
jgi:hypothetical protein